MSYSIENIKEFQNNMLKSTDTFQFDCKMCGDCCRKRTEPILLTGLDIFRISRALGMDPKQVIEEKTIGYIGDQSHVPVLTLKERLDGSCSLLRKGRCMVHNQKPVVCALFPLGRMYNAITHEIQYFKNPYSCMTGSKGGKTWTLQEWLDELNISSLDEESMAWNKMIMGVTSVTCQIDKEKLPDEMIAIVGSCFYLNYDLTKPYVEQVNMNMAILQRVFKEKFQRKIEYTI